MDIRKGQSQWQMMLEWDIKVTKSALTVNTNSEKLNKKNVGFLLNEVGDLAKVNTEKAEGFKTFFSSVFVNKTSFPRPLEKWLKEKNDQE